jgi:hypothetical protein
LDGDVTETRKAALPPLEARTRGLRGQWARWSKVHWLAIRQADLKDGAPTAHAVRAKTTKGPDRSACGLALTTAVVIPSRHARQFASACNRCEQAKAFAEVR